MSVNVCTASALNPRSTDSRREKLRISNPAPTSSTTASIVSATINRLRMRWRFGSLVVLPLSSRMRLTTSPTAVACHAGANLANDYFDHVKGIDTAESLGPSQVIQQGLLSPAAVKRTELIIVSSLP